MHSYLRQAKEDIARITAHGEDKTEALERFAFQSGSFEETTRFYARMADHEAAVAQRTVSDPCRLATAIHALNPDPKYISDLAYRLAEQLAALQKNDLNADWQETISRLEDVGDAAHRQHELIQRRAEDAADALIAAKSDEAYDCRIDAGLIGRQDFLPPLEVTP